MTRRYYVPDLISQHPHVSLPDEEAAHAVKVMRLSVGDTVELFDGCGNQAAAVVTLVDRRHCTCHSDVPQIISREPTRTLELAMAIPKPERAKEMIERLAELGVSRIVPLTFERTQRPPSDSLFAKLERVVIEACKQSTRNQLMTFAPVTSFTRWIRQEVSAEVEPIGTVLHVVAMPGGESLRKLPMTSVARVNCLIGPEGGLSDVELQQCVDAGMQAIDLGKRILRIETAACVVASRLLDD